ncbi:MAG: corrinoid protein [Planctomycetes bacterium]|nr:corrinoid protein [Planctomycetota bacterium]
MSTTAILESLQSAIIDGDEQKAPQFVQTALADKLDAQTILEKGLLAGMAVVGQRFRDGDYFLPEVLISAEAMKAAMTVLSPMLKAQNVKARATAVVGTVRGDLHDIGKNLVAIMLEGAGFEVIDLGVDVPPEKFAQACRDRKVDLVAMSALLTTTMPEMESAIRMLQRELPNPPPVIIGGAPVTQQYADRIGAAGYGRDAASGAEVARGLCAKAG